MAQTCARSVKCGSKSAVGWSQNTAGFLFPVGLSAFIDCNIKCIAQDGKLK